MAGLTLGLLAVNRETIGLSLAAARRRLYPTAQESVQAPSSRATSNATLHRIDAAVAWTAVDGSVLFALCRC